MGSKGTKRQRPSDMEAESKPASKKVKFYHKLLGISDDKETWIVIGDSNVNRFKWYLDPPERGNLVVVPKPGAKIGSMLGLAGALVEEAKEDVVKIVLHVGINDIQSGDDTYPTVIEKLNAVIEEIRKAAGKKTCEVFVCTIPPRQDKGRHAIEQVRRINHHICGAEWQKKGIKAINLDPCCSIDWTLDGVHYDPLTSKEIARRISCHLSHVEDGNSSSSDEDKTEEPEVQI